MHCRKFYIAVNRYASIGNRNCIDTENESKKSVQIKFFITVWMFVFIASRDSVFISLMMIKIEVDLLDLIKWYCVRKIVIRGLNCIKLLDVRMRKKNYKISFHSIDSLIMTMSSNSANVSIVLQRDMKIESVDYWQCPAIKFNVDKEANFRF